MLYNPSTIKQIMNKHNITAKKALGQNFLIDGNIIRNVMDKSGLSSNDVVIEVGPGIGTLTEALAERAHHVIAIEKDDELIPVLADTLAAWDNVTVINGDVLEVDMDELMAPYQDEHDLRLIANLPYYITTPIIAMVLEQQLPLKSLSVMVQKEVGERMTAEPGTKEFGSLSLLCQYYSEPHIIQKVPASVFIPRPKVDSVVVQLDIKEQREDSYRESMFKLIRKAFTKRRKTLPNAMEGALDDLTKDDIRKALQKAEIEEKLRPEDLALSDWHQLAEIIENSRRQ